MPGVRAVPLQGARAYLPRPRSAPVRDRPPRLGCRDAQVRDALDAWTRRLGPPAGEPRAVARGERRGRGHGREGARAVRRARPVGLPQHHRRARRAHDVQGGDDARQPRDAEDDDVADHRRRGVHRRAQVVATPTRSRACAPCGCRRVR